MTLPRASGLLADELFLIAHDDVTGKPRLHPRVMGIALAGALLGELVLYGRVDVRQVPELGTDGVILVERLPVGDALVDSVLDQVFSEGRPRTVRAWLAFLWPTATRGVGDRLAASGLLLPARTGLLRREPRWTPADTPTAARPVTRLRILLSKQDPMTVADAVLGGFAVECGLGQQILWQAPPRAREYLDYLLGHLPEGLRILLNQTEQAVGDAVMNRPI
ncbi:MAG TPA: GPP34 family phosphoprotein [Rugosimonospora sp.]|nr:GPP34 family phosphoprotein [Rugosimonospora sp.]